MTEPFFFSLAFSPTLNELAALVGARLEGDPERRFTGLASLEAAGRGDIAYFDNPKYRQALVETEAGACLLKPAMRPYLPIGVAALITADPYAAFARISAHLLPSSLRQAPALGAGHSPCAVIHANARLENGVDVEPGAVIGADVEIGAGTLVGANSVIGAGVRIGRDCIIGAGVTLSHALVGDRVILHPGARIGQDGFGFAPGARRHIKVPQMGRVIIQDDVEIGANSTIDRGATRDTVIGEGAKIDNLVQIGHNVSIGRHCLIVAQTGIAGSTQIDDFVMIGGQTGIAGHLTIGRSARIAAQSGVMRDVSAYTSVGGTPAQDLRKFLQQAARAKKQAGGPKKTTMK